MDKETFMIIRKVHKFFKKKGLKLSVVKELRLNGKREEIKERAAVSALEFLIEVIES